MPKLAPKTSELVKSSESSAISAHSDLKPSLEDDSSTKPMASGRVGAGISRSSPVGRTIDNSSEEIHDNSERLIGRKSSGGGSSRNLGSASGAKTSVEETPLPDIVRASKGNLVARRKSLFTSNIQSPPGKTRANISVPSRGDASFPNFDQTSTHSNGSASIADKPDTLSQTPAEKLSIKEKLKRYENANAANHVQNSMDKNHSERPVSSRFSRDRFKKTNSSRSVSVPNGIEEINSEENESTKLEQNPSNTPTTTTTIVTTTTTTTIIKKKKKKDGTVISADVIKTDVETEQKILSEVVSTNDTAADVRSPVRTALKRPSKVTSPFIKDDSEKLLRPGSDHSLKTTPKSPYRHTFNKKFPASNEIHPQSLDTEAKSDEVATGDDPKTIDSSNTSSTLPKSASSRNLEKEKKTKTSLNRSDHSSLAVKKKAVASDVVLKSPRKSRSGSITNTPALTNPNILKPTTSGQQELASPVKIVGKKLNNTNATTRVNELKTNLKAVNLNETPSEISQNSGKKFLYPADNGFWKTNNTNDLTTAENDAKTNVVSSDKEPIKKVKHWARAKEGVSPIEGSRNETQKSTEESSKIENETKTSLVSSEKELIKKVKHWARAKDDVSSTEASRHETYKNTEGSSKIEDVVLSESLSFESEKKRIETIVELELDISELENNRTSPQRMRSTDSLSVSVHSHLDIERSAEEWKQKKKHKKRRPKKDKAKSEAKSEVNLRKPVSHKDKKVINIPTVDDLKLHKILGEGSFGQVWLASVDEEGADDKKLKQKTYALKILSKFHLLTNSEIEPTRNEINVLKVVRNQHPCVMNLVAVTQDENLIYLMQEFAQGGELFSLLHNHRNSETGIGGLPENQASFYAACLADALCFLHSKHHLVFRDLKPENVMLNKYGYPVIIDFGYAKFLDEDHPKTYTLVGTPRYMSPELILSIGYDFGTDNWSLGVMIYELLSGFNPFEGPLVGDDEGLDEVELFGIVVEDDYVPLPSSSNFSSAARDIVAALLVKEPALRMGAKDTGEILDHEWFTSNNIDFPSLRRRKITAPWLPDLEGHLDTRHFENWDHLAANQETCVIKTSYPKLTDREQKRFTGIDT